MIRNVIRRTAGAAMDRKGVTAAEYAILAVGLVIVVGAGVTALGPTLKGAFEGVGTQIGTQQSKVTGSVGGS